MEKSCRNYAPKGSLIPLLVNNTKHPLHVRNCLKIRYFERVLSEIRYFERVLSERVLSESLKKVSFIFPFKPNLF